MGARILVVEDERIVALDLQHRLEQLGYGVAGNVPSGERALEALAKGGIDLVLLDILLEGELDGIDVGEHIRQSWDLPFVYLTAYTDPTTLERARRTEPYGYLRKPIEDRQLHVTLEVALTRHDAFRRLHRSEQLLLATLSGIQEAVIVCDQDRRITLINPRAVALTGWANQQALGRELATVLRLEPFTPAPSDARHWLLRRDGGRVAVEASMSPVREGASVTGLQVWVAREITSQLRSEQAQSFRGFVSSELGQAGGTLEEVADQVARLAVPQLGDWCLLRLAAGPEVIAAGAHHTQDVAPLGKLAGWALKNTPNPMRLLQEATPERVLQALGWEDAMAGELPLETTSAMIIPFRSASQPLDATILLGRSRAPAYDTGDLALANDFAWRASVAFENAWLLRSAREAALLRERVLAIVSHDLRNPLTTVVLAARIALERVSDVQVVTGRLRAVQRASDQMLRLIDDLLDVSRIDAGKLSTFPGRIAAQTIVDEVLELTEAVASERKVQLGGVVDPRVGPLHCDRARIVQALANLVSNAVKFTPAGGRVDVRCEPGTEGGEVVFAVTDTGEGIAIEDQPRVFDRFWQSARAARAGAGLGLYITKGIVEAHHGRIWFRSTPGSGSTFLFTVPLERLTAHPPPAPLPTAT